MLGTGAVGRAVAGRLDDLGHDLTMATRDLAATAGREEHTSWAEAHADVRLVPFAGSADGADLVVNALGGDIALGVLDEVGPDLVGRVLLDLSNPLDHGHGFPPRLFVKDDDSFAEQVQRAHPEALVVKTLNTMNNTVMVDPGRLGESTTVFVSGDEPSAKATVTALLRELGHTDVIDLGGLETARGPEMFLALWVRTAVALGGSDFNIKVVRGPSLPA
ncbi:NAD(P)-binding domain-containing protein [Nocardioides conyzicola]|uniref:NAD(P)-binding domain-containing protein n=1 Tax=Nocardioides conyzicola TaxID=1651781 RepID=A0ABP8WQW3_9ACTN